jgi:putative transposase
MLRKQFPGAVPVMEAARDDVLAFLHFPQEHWSKNLEYQPVGAFERRTDRCAWQRSNQTPHQRGRYFPNGAATVRLVGRQLQEQQEEWQVERRRFFSGATMAKMPESEAML